MKIIDVQQGSPEWLQARIGVVTASCMDQIITPKTRKPSSSQDKYLRTLLAEWLLGQPIDTFQSEWMVRGSEMEDEAVARYEFEHDAETSRVGLCLRDDGKVGASPDRLIGTDGVLEIKVPSIETHVGYMLNNDALRDAYFVQVQGELLVTGRAWGDLVSYHPILPSVRVRIEPDADFVDTLSPILAEFVTRLDEAKERLAEHRIPAPAARIVRDADPFATEPQDKEDAPWLGL